MKNGKKEESSPAIKNGYKLYIKEMGTLANVVEIEKVETLTHTTLTGTHGTKRNGRMFQTA